MSVITGLIEKGMIDKADASLWLDNAIAMIEQTKKQPSQTKSDALAIIRNELLALLG